MRAQWGCDQILDESSRSRSPDLYESGRPRIDCVAPCFHPFTNERGLAESARAVPIPVFGGLGAGADDLIVRSYKEDPRRSDPFQAHRACRARVSRGRPSHENGRDRVPVLRVLLRRADHGLPSSALRVHLRPGHFRCGAPPVSRRRKPGRSAACDTRRALSGWPGWRCP